MKLLPVSVTRAAVPPAAGIVHRSPELLSRLGESEVRTAVLCFDRSLVPPPHRAFEMPQGAADYARKLYEALRTADGLGCAEILIERPPTGNEIWKAVHDRLHRAMGQ